jgi:hypothetical protein
MSSENFSWEIFEESLPQINDYLSMFLGLKNEFTFQYFFDMARIQNIFPLEKLALFYSYPPFYVKLLTYD